MKKASIVALIGVSMVLSGCGLLRRNKNQEPEPTPRARISEPVNIVDVSERPYIKLVPSQNGRNIDIVIGETYKDASEAEFEMEYQAGDLIRGAFGSIQLDNGQGEYEILLGSCSTGGTCSYDSDVTGGNVTVSMRGGDENYAVKYDWRYQEVASADDQFGSGDQKIQISGTNIFADSSYVIIADTSGYPAPVDGEVIGGPYGIFPSNGLSDSDEATVTLRTQTESESASIQGWDGSEWVTLDTTIDGKSVSTEGAVYEAYVVVQ